jgi:phosphate transport system permease protein
MSTTLKPGKPWEPTGKEKGQKALNLIIAIALSILLLFVTGLNGKLGLFAAFVISYTSVSFIAEYRRAGKPAAQDSLLTSISRLAMLMAVIPIVSIVGTVASKGWRGLHFGIFTQDMSQASVNSPIEDGGMLAAIVGTFIMVGLALLLTLPIAIFDSALSH